MFLWIKKLFAKRSNINAANAIKKAISFETTSRISEYSVVDINIPMRSYYVYSEGVYDELFDIRNNIRRARATAKLTQKQLATCLGHKSTSFVSRLENSELQRLEYADLVKVAICLNVPLEELLRGYKRTKIK